MVLVQTAMVINAEIISSSYNNNYGCASNCLDACDCNGNCKGD